MTLAWMTGTWSRRVGSGCNPRLGDDRRASRLDLLVHPGIGAGDAVRESVAGTPTDGVDPLVTEVSRLDTDRALDVFGVDGLGSDLSDGVHELRDRDVLGTADIGRARQRRMGQAIDPVDHVIDVRVGTNGLAVTPHLDGAAVSGLGDLAADSGGRPFPPPRPPALRSGAILEPPEPGPPPPLATESERHPPGIKPFPTPPAFR